MKKIAVSAKKFEVRKGNKIDLLKFFSVLVFLAIGSSCKAQHLQPGFDVKELTEVMCVSARAGGAKAYYSDSNFIAEPQHYKPVYRSAPMGLMNLWELWKDDRNTAIISIRGTTTSSVSWLANFYSAMVPAEGKMILATQDTFHYKLAADPKAAVHVGWLVAMAYLSKEILPKIDSCYKQGIKEFIITGHSQGGGISYLLTAYLRNLQLDHRLPEDIRFKTYCTAAPKPGNLYFAYDYEYNMRGGWEFNVVSERDWVPEVPFSIQTVNDLNNVNPFRNARKMIGKQKFPKNLVLKHIYNKLDKPTRQAQRNSEHYLGKMMAKQVGKVLKGIEVDQYYHSNDYVRTGTTILLKPDSAYMTRFPDSQEQVFRHHFHQAYLFMIDPSMVRKQN